MLSDATVGKTAGEEEEKPEADDRGKEVDGFDAFSIVAVLPNVKPLPEGISILDAIPTGLTALVVVVDGVGSTEEPAAPKFVEGVKISADADNGFDLKDDTSTAALPPNVKGALLAVVVSGAVSASVNDITSEEVYIKIRCRRIA